MLLPSCLEKTHLFRHLTASKSSDAPGWAFFARLGLVLAAGLVADEGLSDGLALGLGDPGHHLAHDADEHIQQQPDRRGPVDVHGEKIIGSLVWLVEFQGIGTLTQKPSDHGQKKGALVWLVEVKGNPYPKKVDTRAPLGSSLSESEWIGSFFQQWISSEQMRGFQWIGSFFQ